ncbi:hypothetical protein, partial [Bartonella henselae]|uniref:hypothetical protein n=1 Tax=Bartonella henselae TaxID=38323 RepID=UPI001AECC0EB
ICLNVKQDIILYFIHTLVLKRHPAHLSSFHDDDGVFCEGYNGKSVVHYPLYAYEGVSRHCYFLG